MEACQTQDLEERIAFALVNREAVKTRQQSAATRLKSRAKDNFHFLDSMSGQNKIIPKDNVPLIKNILVPRFDTHGDIVLLEGFVERLIEVFPHATITLLVRTGYKQLAELFPGNLRWLTTDLNPNLAPGEEDGDALSAFLRSTGRGTLGSCPDDHLQSLLA